MSHLKSPIQGGGRWLRQATVLGLGVGLLAGTGLIVTASVASAHSAAPATATSHGPSRACALIIGRPGPLRVRPQRCRPPMVIGLASPVCKGRLLPAPGRVAIARPVRPPKALRLAGRGRLQLPVLRIRACAGRVLRFKPAQLRLCRAARPAQTPLAAPARSCLSRLRIRPVQLRVCGRVRPAQVKLRMAARPARLQLVAPARACSLVPVPARH